VPLSEGFTLGELRVNPPEGGVTGPGGTQQLDPKVMGVLVVLAEHAGHVVPREELLTRLWPNTVVSDDALTRCLYELRRQLALAGGGDDYRALVETLPKRGYRLNGTVGPQAVEAPVAGRRTVARVAGSVALLAVALVAVLVLRPFSPRPSAADRPSIAVLPFADMSESQDQQYLADGLAEEILDRLHQSTDLRVIARTSSFWFRGKDVDVPTIARKLDVTHVLEGSVRRAGNELRITAQLISAHDSSHVWSTTFERELGDLFAIQDEIAVSVATALDAALAPGGAGHAATPSTEGYDSFLRGEYFYYRRGTGDIDRALAAYEAAVRRDPDFARAWASLAGAYSFKAWQSGQPQPELLERQRQAAERAVELDPKLPIAHIRLAQYFAETGRTGQGQHRAIAGQLDPGHPILLSWAADDSVARGDLKGAIEKLERAVAREPLLPLYRNNLAVLLLADGQLERALTEYRRVNEMSPGGELGAWTDIVLILVLQGRTAEAKAALGELPAGKRRDYGQALLLNAPGERGAADAAYVRLLGDVDQGATQEEVHDTIQLAELQVFRGDLEVALATLQAKRDAYARAAGQAPEALWYLRHEAKVSPFLKPLHADPRWAAFMKEPD
jgi:TolB-like protein